MVGDQEYDCYEDGWCCDYARDFCQQFDNTGSCSAVDMYSYQYVDCQGDEEEASDDDDSSDGELAACPVNFAYRILVTFLNFFIGYFGLTKLFWGIDGWVAKMIVGIIAIAGAVPLMVLGLLTVNIALIVIGVLLLVTIGIWNLIDSAIWLFGEEYYREADVCYVWLDEPAENQTFDSLLVAI